MLEEAALPDRSDGSICELFKSLQGRIRGHQVQVAIPFYIPTPDLIQWGDKSPKLKAEELNPDASTAELSLAGTMPANLHS